MGSKSNVSGFFRLQFRNGLGTKLAGVLLFRMRVPSTFFMGFVWWLAGFQVLRCAKVCLAVSHGLGAICDCGRTVGYLTMAPLHGTSLAVCACRDRFAKGNVSRMLFLKAACNVYAWLGHLWVPKVCFSGFQKRRFGIFPAAVSQWLGHKTCWGSLPSLSLRDGYSCWKPNTFLFLVGLSLQNSSSMACRLHFTCHYVVGQRFAVAVFCA